MSLRYLRCRCGVDINDDKRSLLIVLNNVFVDKKKLENNNKETTLPTSSFPVNWLIPSELAYSESFRAGRLINFD